MDRNTLGVTKSYTTLYLKVRNDRASREKMLFVVTNIGSTLIMSFLDITAREAWMHCCRKDSREVKRW